MRRTPVFGDPKTETSSSEKRIFGQRRPQDGPDRLPGRRPPARRNPTASPRSRLLPPSSAPKSSELEVLDRRRQGASCLRHHLRRRDAGLQRRGVRGKRVVYNVAKAYTNQLGVGVAFPELDEVIGISICDFELWPHGEAPHVPMTPAGGGCRNNTNSGVKGLPQLPGSSSWSYPSIPEGTTRRVASVDKWAYFFRIRREPDGHPGGPPATLRSWTRLEGRRGRRASTREEWDAYIAAGMAIQNERGALCRSRAGRGAPRARLAPC